ncbi:MAG: hypothetical protein Q9183_006632, partial [Haloplaca sp. 2 TL-2023]
TLALVTQSLTALEAGDLCILSFGSDVRVALPFGTPFSASQGAHVFQHFSFQQTKTNILKLLTHALDLFRQAREMSGGRGGEVWQLGIIIGDGVCEDHDAIRLLLRKAMEERIMFVFVIIDAVNEKGEGSIVDMQEAVFEDAEPMASPYGLSGGSGVGEAGDGEGSGKVGKTREKKLKIRRYLDNFPFRYYVVVGEIGALPSVLAQALRGWFGEVVGERF